jgi:Sec-independent protein secretion pathway component TatC
MSKNWSAWWITTISINIFIATAIIDPSDITRALVLTNTVWAIFTVVCLWARRVGPNGEEESNGKK